MRLLPSPSLIPRRPQIYGACDVGVGVGADFVPFRLLSTAEGAVNLCNRASIPITEKSHCPRGASIVDNFENAVATSYFKMSKWYVDAAGVLAGTPYGVARQPCTVSLTEGRHAALSPHTLRQCSMKGRATIACQMHNSSSSSSTSSRQHASYGA